MGKEIERKYLVRSDAWREQVQSKASIQQGYLSLDEGRNVRIRIEDDHAFLTIKGEPKGHVRAEYEYPMPIRDATQIMENLCLNPLIKKTRNKIPMGKLTWEIDEFAGENSPLVLAEVETPSRKGPSTTPEWVGDEVSDDPRYLNINLVGHPFREWGEKSSHRKTKFYLKRSESIALGLERIITELLAAAVEQLQQSEQSLEDAVHEARKSIKKVRAVLRLIRPLMGSDYDRGNGALRDIGRKLSDIRDAQALIETFDYLNANYRDELGDASLNNFRQSLLDQKRKQTEEFDSTYQIPQLVAALQKMGKHANHWSYKSATMDILAKGVANSLRRGRDQFYEVDDRPFPEIFHEWRKRAKDLCYQLNLLKKLWPDVFEGYLNSYKKLEKLLGMDHNLTVLRKTLYKADNELGQDEKRLLLVIDLDQKAIRRKAEKLGERIYSEEPKQWRQRINQSWDAWLKRY
jgi:adenylate cyclase